MRHIRWGFFFIGILIWLIFVIAFFQNFNPLFYANWAFLFVPTITSNPGLLIVLGFLGGFLTATMFFIAVKGGRYDPNMHGKDQPDTWERIADQF